MFWKLNIKVQTQLSVWSIVEMPLLQFFYIFSLFRFMIVTDCSIELTTDSFGLKLLFIDICIAQLNLKMVKDGQGIYPPYLCRLSPNFVLLVSKCMLYTNFLAKLDSIPPPTFFLTQHRKLEWTFAERIFITINSNQQTPTPHGQVYYLPLLICLT